MPLPARDRPGAGTDSDPAFPRLSINGVTLPELLGTTVLQRFGFVPIPAGPHVPAADPVRGMVCCVPRQARRPAEVCVGAATENDRLPERSGRQRMRPRADRGPPHTEPDRQPLTPVPPPAPPFTRFRTSGGDARDTTAGGREPALCGYGRGAREGRRCGRPACRSRCGSSPHAPVKRRWCCPCRERAGVRERPGGGIPLPGRRSGAPRARGRRTSHVRVRCPSWRPA